jgi:hypothetical protein
LLVLSFRIWFSHDRVYLALAYVFFNEILAGKGFSKIIVTAYFYIRWKTTRISESYDNLTHETASQLQRFLGPNKGSGTSLRMRQEAVFPRTYPFLSTTYHSSLHLFFRVAEKVGYKILEGVFVLQLHGYVGASTSRVDKMSCLGGVRRGYDDVPRTDALSSPPHCRRVAT